MIRRFALLRKPASVCHLVDCQRDLRLGRIRLFEEMHRLGHPASWSMRVQHEARHQSGGRLQYDTFGKAVAGLASSLCFRIFNASLCPSGSHDPIARSEVPEAAVSSVPFSIAISAKSLRRCATRRS